MTDERVNFLLKAASVLSGTEDKTLQILRSHYLLRSKKLTGPKLLTKCFSKETRCGHCYIEWNTESEAVVKSIKLTRRQKQRLKYTTKKRKTISKKYLLHSNELEKICSFCGYSTKVAVPKPNITPECVTNDNYIVAESTEVTKKENKKSSMQKNNETNVYCKSKVAFCLRKQKKVFLNPNPMNVPPKIIKNNKKKKDKLAGLCQTAVKAAAKLKQEQKEQNKLNLFLKPSV